jgi:hypothetical protein
MYLSDYRHHIAEDWNCSIHLHEKLKSHLPFLCFVCCSYELVAHFALPTVQISTSPYTRAMAQAVSRQPLTIEAQV